MEIYHEKIDKLDEDRMYHEYELYEFEDMYQRRKDYYKLAKKLEEEKKQSKFNLIGKKDHVHEVPKKKKPGEVVNEEDRWKLSKDPVGDPNESLQDMLDRDSGKEWNMPIRFNPKKNYHYKTDHDRDPYAFKKKKLSEWDLLLKKYEK